MKRLIRTFLGLFMSVLIPSCSLDTSSGKSLVVFETQASFSDTTDNALFALAANYDYACLTYSGGDGVQMSSWKEIKNDSNASLAVQFETPNLLGGYTYFFTVFAVDIEKTEKDVLAFSCPKELPVQEGWAQLGQIKVFVPQKVNEKLVVTIPFILVEAVASENPLPPEIPGLGVPTEVMAAVSGTSITLSWTPPLSNGGSAIIGYDIEYSTDFTFTSPIATYSTSPGKTVTGLHNNTTYYFRVRAENSSGPGGWSNTAQATIPPAVTVPAACQGDCYLENVPFGTERLGPAGSTIFLFRSQIGGKIWKEKGGMRILNASGDPNKGWQKKLNRNGTSFADDFLDEGGVLVGRVCPQNVFIDFSHMTETGRCLYYNLGTPSVSLYSAGGDIAQDYLADWNLLGTGQNQLSSYFEGNIKICADLGMRLPVAYETTMSSLSSNPFRPNGDSGVNPQWDPSNGVPAGDSIERFWTASGYNSLNNFSRYWTWGDSAGASGGNDYYANFATARCVIPGP